MTAVGPYLRSRTLVLNGGPIRLHEAGTPAPGAPGAPLVLLLHGAGYDTAEFSWQHLARALAADFRVVGLDFPRHGGSRPWPAALRIGQEQLVRVVEAVRLELRAERFALVGVSMGSAVALGYCLRYPQRTSRAALLAPAGVADTVPHHFASWLLARTPGVPRLLARHLARWPKALRSSIVTALADGEGTPGLAELLDVATAEARAKAAHGEGAFDDWQVLGMGPRRILLDMRPGLASLAVPTLWVRGAGDRFITRDCVAEAARTAGAWHVEVPGAGHLLPNDRPQDVARLVRAFLLQSSPSRPAGGT